MVTGKVQHWLMRSRLALIAFAVGYTSLYWFAMLTSNMLAYLIWMYAMLPGYMMFFTGSLFLGLVESSGLGQALPDWVGYALGSLLLLAAGIFQALFFRALMMLAACTCTRLRQAI